MSKKEWLAGMRAIYPVCFGYIPMGLACGVLLQQAGYHWLAVMLMSLLIYGGASQFMIASMTVAGAGLLEMVIMIFFINLRHLLMSSSLAHRIREKSTAFSIFFAQTITDESFAVNTLYFKTEGMWNPTKAIAANVTAYATWILSTGIGAMAGKSIALSPVVMNYILIAMFIFLLISQIENRIVFWTAVFSSITAVLLMSSSLAHRIREKSTAFSIFFAQTITDESFAVNTLYFRTEGMWNPTKAMAANVTAYSTWIISTGIGAMAGKSIALSPVVMNYILIAMFIFLLISQIENRIVFWTAVFSGITAVVLMNLLRHNIAIVLTSILASGFGLYLQNKKDDKEGILRG